ncbi:hypothetical protein RFW18_20715 [Metabacillus idriensis]|uniref:hypothetical protein n=1 Tax=Metabacillus idriensis TaxID=324768 RepID=UPI002812CDFC|nr:hypothetical protein [Metabacillus idriensis]MDR0140187.1 hypothetical protein [Metabacillus idriensis]
MNEKTCPYCGSDIRKMNEFQYFCGFCDMRVNSNKAMQNNERLEVRVREFVADHYIDKRTEELMDFSTYELLYLLKFIRKERSDMYHYMKTFNRAGELEETNPFEEIEKETARNYMYLSKKMFVVENIIRERLGYVPVRITEAYLVKYLENIKNDKKSLMSIRIERVKKHERK